MYVCNVWRTHRSSKRQSLSTTVLFITTFTRRIMFNLQSWTKVLGTVRQYSYFSVISRSPLKTVHPFRNSLAVLPPPTLYKVESRKKFWMHASNIVCGVRGGAGPVWIGKRPRNANVSQDFCPWLSEKEVRRKKAVLRVFQACKSVFSGFRWKIVIEQTFSQLFRVFWTCFKNSLETNDIHQKL